MIGAIASLSGVFLLSSIASTTLMTASPGATARKQLVLVELFTSEGCSSCPPADALLKTLSEQQPIAGVEIVALEEHVDYWDQLGWKDPYSSSEFTERQTRYADVFRSRGVYTPQMVVDGHIEVVGSRARQATEAIQRAASLPKAEIEMKKIQDTAKGAAAFALTVGQLNPPLVPAKTELWVAVTEKSLQSDVKAGENAGERLQHAAVVRTIQKVKPARGSSDYPDSVTLDLKDNWKPENLLVVAFLVDKSSRSIVGLGAAPVATAN
jgi:hypothetical protein